MRSQVFHAARSYARDALLQVVKPRHIRVLRTPLGIFYVVADWYCVFSTAERDCAFQVSLNDPGWINPEFIVRGEIRGASWLSELHLEECHIDSRLAHLIAVQSGCRPPIWLMRGEAAPQSTSPELTLTLALVQGKWRCVWGSPFFMLGDERIAVTADCGEVYCMRENAWIPLNNSIWNTFSGQHS